MKKFFSYFCYKAERDDRRLRRLEESINLPPVSPLHRFPDPFDEFDAVHGGAPSTAAGDEDLGGSTGYDAGFAYEDIFGGGAGGSGYVPPQHYATTSSDPHGKRSLVDYDDDSDNED